MFVSETELIVRYAETDQMGIVHHSNYPIWFEAGRTEYIKELGISYSKIEELGLMLPVIELRCAYKGAARYEDEVIIRTSLGQMTGIRLIFSYEVVRKADSSIITTGETTHVWTDRGLKPVNLKKYNPEVYELLVSQRSV